MKTYKIPVFLFLLLNSFYLSAQDKADSAKFKTAIEYNNYIIDEQVKVTDAMNVFAKAINDNSVNDFDKYFKIQLDQSQSSLSAIKKLGTYNGNGEFRYEAVKLFAFYYKTTRKKISIFIKILKKQDRITAGDKKRINRINDKIVVKEEALNASFVLAQQKFAKENNFTIAK
ncbi:MAG: hypothetical protein V1904_05215 [Bacteroidota bacterium]